MATRAEKTNVPHLRFSEFEGEWLSVQLGQISTNITSGSRDWAQFYADSGSKFIRMTNLRRDGIELLLDDLKYVSLEAGSSEGQRTSLQGGDILISITAELGKIGLVPNNLGEAYINQHTALVRPDKSKAVPAFLAQYLATRASNKRLNRLNDSGAKSGLNLSTVGLFTIAIPPLPEQKKIAAFLGAADEKLTALRKKRDLLAAYKRGAMQQIFSQKIRFTRDDGATFPDWEEKRLGDVFTEVTDKVGVKDIPTFSISAGKGFVSQKEKFGKDISGRQNENYTVLDFQEFAYNKGNSKSYKFGCVYPNDTGYLIAVPNVFICFRPRNKNVFSGFYAKLFENHFLDKGLRRIISSGARMDGLLNVNKEYFFDLKIPEPHPDEQKKIANFLSALDTKIDAVAAQITQMEAFKKGLLQRMFV